MNENNEIEIIQAGLWESAAMELFKKHNPGVKLMDGIMNGDYLKVSKDMDHLKTKYRLSKKIALAGPTTKAECMTTTEQRYETSLYYKNFVDTFLISLARSVSGADVGDEVSFGITADIKMFFWEFMKTKLEPNIEQNDKRSVATEDDSSTGDDKIK